MKIKLQCPQCFSSDFDMYKDDWEDLSIKRIDFKCKNCNRGISLDNSTTNLIGDFFVESKMRGSKPDNIFGVRTK